MNRIDFTPFGFPGRVFEYHGQIVGQKETGSRLLFLFNETHSNKAAIRQNVQNATALSDMDLVSCVGVEEYPFFFVGWTNEAIADLWNEYLESSGGTEQAAIDYSLLSDGACARFGKALKLAKPEIEIFSVDELELHTLAGLIKMRCQQLPDTLSPKATQVAKEAALKLLDSDYEMCPTNLARDDAFLRNLFARWDQHGTTKAAILNAGRSHQDRIVRKLPAHVRFIQLDTSATQS